jgi:integrase
MVIRNRIIMSGAKAGDKPQGGARGFTLYSPAGDRKYVNQAERRRINATARHLKRSRMLFVMLLMLTGARLSEVLALTAASFQLESGCVSIRTLKRRRPVMREVPLPPWLIDALEAQFRISQRQETAEIGARLWPFTRWTAWRLIKQVMARSGISGAKACPRGLRHGFGVGGAQAGIPITPLQRWLGHARLTTTAIYLEVSGPEERAIAARWWEAM